MVKVSIIMPVYNSQEYIDKAIESVLTQNFEGFELILVNDGSTDESGKLCDEYAARDKRVVVIHKQNGGICSARNAGLQAAQGEYVGFCDNDDIYLPGLIKDNYEFAHKNNIDLMRYSKIKRLEKANGKAYEVVADIEDLIVEKENFYKHYRNIRKEDTVWTGLYRRQIIEDNNVRFDESFKFGLEDYSFNLSFLMHCQRLGFNSKPYYVWTQRETHSTSRKFRRAYQDDTLRVLNAEYLFYSQVCKKKVDKVMFNEFLANSYIYHMLDYLDIPGCDLTKKEKANVLDKMRNCEIFDEETPNESLNVIRKKNKRQYITLKLFYDRKYSSLIFVVNNGKAILSKFRYKKQK